MRLMGFYLWKQNPDRLEEGKWSPPKAADTTVVGSEAQRG